MDDTPLVARLLATRDDLRFLEALDHHATPPADRLTTSFLDEYRRSEDAVLRDQMVRALRAFVAANGDDPLGALARVARGEPVKPPPPLEPPPPPPRPAPAPLRHAGFDALFAAAHAMMLDDWTRVVQEVHAARRRHDPAAATIAQWYRPAITAEDALGGPLGAARRRRWDRLAQPLVQQVTMWLPLARVERGGRIRLQPRAWQLVSTAQRAILTHAAFGDDIAADVETVLQPFGDEVVWATLGDR